MGRGHQHAVAQRPQTVGSTIDDSVRFAAIGWLVGRPHARPRPLPPHPSPPRAGAASARPGRLARPLEPPSVRETTEAVAEAATKFATQPRQTPRRATARAPRLSARAACRVARNAASAARRRRTTRLSRGGPPGARGPHASRALTPCGVPSACAWHALHGARCTVYHGCAGDGSLAVLVKVCRSRCAPLPTAPPRRRASAVPLRRTAPLCCSVVLLRCASELVARPAAVSASRPSSAGARRRAASRRQRRAG